MIRKRPNHYFFLPLLFLNFFFSSLSVLHPFPFSHLISSSFSLSLPFLVPHPHSHHHSHHDHHCILFLSFSPSLTFFLSLSVTLSGFFSFSQFFPLTIFLTHIFFLSELFLLNKKLEPPKWLLEPRDSSTIAGSDVTLDCGAYGSPEPSITWKKAGGKYTDYGYHFLLNCFFLSLSSLLVLSLFPSPLFLLLVLSSFLFITSSFSLSFLLVLSLSLSLVEDQLLREERETIITLSSIRTLEELTRVRKKKGVRERKLQG